MLLNSMLRPFFLALCLFASCSRGEDKVPPHVVVISLDTLRADHMGVYGYHRDTTPFLDGFAQDALVYDNARTTWTWTLIAHMSLLTGLYPAQHQVWTKESVLADGPWTLAARLKAAGYETLGTYNTPGWLEPHFGFDRGFDSYEPHRDVIEASSIVKRMLAGRDTSAPLFLFMHLFDIHNGSLLKKGPLYDPPDPWANRFMDSARAIASEDKLDTPATKNGLWYGPKIKPSEIQHEALRALYDGGISHVDDQLRLLFDFLEDAGILKNSIVIITADHGEGLGERWKKYGGHGGTFEEGMRVPLLIQLPGKGRRTGRVSTPVSLVDLVPTIVELCGLPPDPRLVGVSLLGDVPSNRLIHGQHSDRSVSYHGKWKVIQDDRLDNLQVYDLEADPGEVALVPDIQEWQELQDLGIRLFDQAKEAQENWFQLGPAALDGPRLDHEDAMRALGYGGGG